MLSIANASYSPIEKSLTMPQQSTVCNEHILAHFDATTKTPMERIKDMEKQLIALGVDAKEFEDKDELEEMRQNDIENKEPHKDPLDENDIKKKSTLKPTNQDKIDAMIKEARELRQLIQDLP